MIIHSLVTWNTLFFVHEHLSCCLDLFVHLWTAHPVGGMGWHAAPAGALRHLICCSPLAPRYPIAHQTSCCTTFG